MKHPLVHSDRVNAVRTRSTRGTPDAVNARMHFPITVLTWVVAGGTMGWFASLLLKRRDRRDTLINVVLGALGAVLGGVIVGSMLSERSVNQQLLITVGVAVVSAGVLLAIWRAVSRVDRPLSSKP